MAISARAFGHKGRVVYQGVHVVVSFDPDKAGIARCAVGPELAASVLLVADKGMVYAVAVSPRSKRPPTPGHRHYQDAFVVEPGTVHDIGHPPMVRVAARLMNISEQATVVEVGTPKSRKYRILGRTLDHLNGSNPTAQ